MPRRLPIFDDLTAMTSKMAWPAAVTLACTSVVVSLWKKSQSSRFFSHIRCPGTTVDPMSSSEFERLVGESFRLQGYTVCHEPVGSTGQGVGLVLTKGKETFLVECKHWRTRTVNVAVVRELHASMTARRATGGFVVTFGLFSASAETFAARYPIELIDGRSLQKVLDQAVQDTVSS